MNVSVEAGLVGLVGLVRPASYPCSRLEKSCAGIAARSCELAVRQIELVRGRIDIVVSAESAGSISQSLLMLARSSTGLIVQFEWRGPMVGYFCLLSKERQWEAFAFDRSELTQRHPEAGVTLGKLPETMGLPKRTVGSRRGKTGRCRL